jgi:hypothetical protein
MPTPTLSQRERVSPKATGEGLRRQPSSEALIPHPAAPQPPSPYGRRFTRTALLVFALLVLPTADGSAEDTSVDLELVLAIDASSSVDADEWALQQQGYASAFRDPRVVAAITSGPRKQIGVSVLVWADSSVPKWDSDWFVLSTSAEAERFAGFMSRLPRIPEGGTGIGAGIAMAIRKLDRNGLDAPRQVVDVSGDGRETPAREIVVLIPMANAMARARGVTVNGLAILNEDAGLAGWYRDNVIAGRGSFVITAADYDDFAEAIMQKLLREITHQQRLSLR